MLNVFVMDWLSGALAHPFKRYSYLFLLPAATPKVVQTYSMSVSETQSLGFPLNEHNDKHQKCNGAEGNLS